MEITKSSKPPLHPPLDRLSAVLDRFRVRAHLFHAGPLCGVTLFEARPGRAFLHVLRRGELTVVHRTRGRERRVRVAEPALLFYPRALEHAFHNPPAEGSDFACATLDFEGGAQHPLAQALPAVTVIPLREIAGLQETLGLLFAETERVRCGQRLLADRLFEVLLVQLLRWMLDHPGAARLPAGLLAGLADPRLARALAAVHERPGEPWGLDSLAAQAGMSRSAFAAGFRAAVGQTPAAYLLRWRMAIAQAELRQGAQVKAVADAAGYGNAASFSRAFTAAQGLSPREWLRRERAGTGARG
jgi:AraC-like DNA-binding protein